MEVRHPFGGAHRFRMSGIRLVLMCSEPFFGDVSKLSHTDLGGVRTLAGKIRRRSSPPPSVEMSASGTMNVWQGEEIDSRLLETELPKAEDQDSKFSLR